MANLCKKYTTVAIAILVFLLTGLIPYEQHTHLRFSAEAGEGGTCIDYDEEENTIAINCNASFLDVVITINDPDVIVNLGNGEYILNANLEVADGITFEMTANQDGLQYLKIAGENGIIVYGKIAINGVTITSWDISDEEVIQQNINGTIPRGYIQFAASEGAQIINSEFGYLGDVEPGRRGFDLFGGGGPSHDMLIRGSRFHDLWMAFYSNGAYNITVDGNEYYNNIKYSLDPHTTTHDMNITNNWIHDNPIGPICSDRCWDILIEGNLIQDTATAAIFFSRNMTDSTARDNHVINAETGILLSESPNNQVYNNTIEGATREGIRLLTPQLADDGVTVGNVIYDNVISDSENGIRATRSHNNIVEDIRFSDIEESEYRLLGDSSLIIRGQHFDNALISEDDSVAGNFVEIVDSGIIEVFEGERDGEEEEEEEDGGGDDNGSGDDEEEEEQREGELYNTDIEPFRRTLNDGDEITVNSSQNPPQLSETDDLINDREAIF
jgi:parallel beta-helix repeat protein